MKYCSHRSQCEMKFAHIRASEYFTFAKQIFHSEAISHGKAIFHSPKANFVEKSTCFGKCFFLAPPAGLEPERQTRSESSSLQTCFARFAPVHASREQDVATPQIQQREPTKSEPPKGDSLFAELVGRNCNLINHAGGVYIISPKGWISSTRSVVYHQAAGKMHAGA